MAHPHANIFTPILTDWEHFGADGDWLQNFVSLLDCLPSKYPNFNQSEIEAFQSLISLTDSLINTEGWCGRVDRAAVWDNTFLVPKEFAEFVADGRHGVMTYKQVKAFLKANRKQLFGFTASETAGLRLSLEFLNHLRELRTHVRKVIDFIDMDSTFEARGLSDNKLYKFNPRKMYAEFKDHYAYETALCIPMY